MPAKTAPLLNEAELVARACRGDREAFAALYDAYVDRIYRYVYFRVGGAAEAEDLTSAVFLKAWEAVGGYQPRGLPFAAWLFRIAHNAVVDHYRTRRETASLDAPGTVVEDPTPGVAAAVEQSLTGETLRAALGGLTEDQRQVIVMKLIEGYSTEEIAAALGKKPGAIRALQMRGLQALANLLDPDS